MQLSELKSKLKEHTLSNDLIVFVCDKSRFLAEQYKDLICQERSLDEKHIGSLAELNSSLSLIVDNSDYVNVLTTDVFDEYHDDYHQFTDTIVICDSIKEKKIENALKDYIIKTPALKQWQVLDYIKARCPSLDQDLIEWLYDATGGSIERIDNELDKISLFDKTEQNNALIAIKNSPKSDLYKIIDKSAKKPMADIYVLKNWIISRDYKNLSEFLYHESNMDCSGLNPFTLVNLLMFDLKNRLVAKSMTAAEMGISDGQYKFLKYNKLGYSLPTMLQKLDFLSSFDLKVKSGNLDIDNSKLLDYVICNML